MGGFHGHVLGDEAAVVVAAASPDSQPASPAIITTASNLAPLSDTPARKSEEKGTAYNMTLKIDGI